MEDLKQKYLDELKCLSNLEYRDEIKIAELTKNFNGMSIEIRKKEKLLQLEQWAYLSTHPSKRLNSFCYDDDDEDYTIAVTPVLSTEEPDNSLNQFEDFSESNDEFSSIDDDSFSFETLDYVEASPSDSELVSSEVIEIVISEVGGIDDDILLTIQDDILRENLLNVNHLFAKIEASNDNPIPFYDPIISGTPLTLTPSGESDLFLEVDAFLAVEDEPTSSQFPKSYLDPDGDILLLEAFLNDDHSSDLKTKSSSTSLNSFLEETNNFDNSLPEFTTFSNVLFDAEYESDFSDDQSCSDEDVLKKIASKPLFEEEIIPMKMDQHPDNAESDLLESLRTHDSSLLISSKIDSLLDEFADKLTLLKSIPPGIDETDCGFEEDIHLIEKLLYDNSSPRLPKEFVSANYDAAIESFSPSPILVKDSDSLIEEIDLSCTPDYPMPPALRTMIMTLKGRFLFLRTCLAIIPFHLLKKSHSILIFLRFLVLLQNHQMEKSPDLLSHRGLKAFQPFATCPMMIHG
nr:hypothetical protein [Tanacetum cinerariifolium]